MSTGSAFEISRDSIDDVFKRVPVEARTGVALGLLVARCERVPTKLLERVAPLRPDCSTDPLNDVVADLRILAKYIDDTRFADVAYEHGRSQYSYLAEWHSIDDVHTLEHHAEAKRAEGGPPDRPWSAADEARWKEDKRLIKSVERLGSQPFCLIASLASRLPCMWRVYLTTAGVELVTGWIADVHKPRTRARDLADVLRIEQVFSALFLLASEELASPHDDSIDLGGPLCSLLHLMYVLAPRIMRAHMAQSTVDEMAQIAEPLRARAAARQAALRKITQQRRMYHTAFGTLQRDTADNPIVYGNNVYGSASYPLLADTMSDTPYAARLWGAVAPSFAHLRLSSTCKGRLGEVLGYLATGNPVTRMNRVVCVQFLDALRHVQSRDAAGVSVSSTGNVIRTWKTVYGSWIKPTDMGCMSQDSPKEIEHDAFHAPGYALPAPLIVLGLMDPVILGLMLGLPNANPDDLTNPPTGISDSMVINALSLLCSNHACEHPVEMAGAPVVHPRVHRSMMRVGIMHAIVAGRCAFAAGSPVQGSADEVLQLFGHESVYKFELRKNTGFAGERPREKERATSGCVLLASSKHPATLRWVELSCYAVGYTLACPSVGDDNPFAHRAGGVDGEPKARFFHGEELHALVHPAAVQVDDACNRFAFGESTGWARADLTTLLVVTASAIGAALCMSVAGLPRDKDNNAIPKAVGASRAAMLFERYKQLLTDLDLEREEQRQLERSLWRLLPCAIPSYEQARSVAPMSRAMLEECRDANVMPYGDDLTLGRAALRCLILHDMADERLFAHVLDCMMGGPKGLLRTEVFELLLLAASKVELGGDKHRIMTCVVPALLDAIDTANTLDGHGLGECTDTGYAIRYAARETLASRLAVSFPDEESKQWLDRVLRTEPDECAHPTLHWLQQHFPALVWPLHQRLHPSPWDRAAFEACLVRCNPRCTASLALAEVLMMPEPDGAGLTAPPDEPFLVRLQQVLYAPPEGGPAFQALQRAPRNRALAGSSGGDLLAPTPGEAEPSDGDDGGNNDGNGDPASKVARTA